MTRRRSWQSKEVIQKELVDPLRKEVDASIAEGAAAAASSALLSE